MAPKHATVAGRESTSGSNWWTAPPAPYAEPSSRVRTSIVGSYVVVDVVISRLTIATGTAAISTSVASVRQLRRTSLIDTSRISPSASGRSCGAAAGSALIPGGSVPTAEAVSFGGRGAGSGGVRRAVGRAAGGAVRSRRRPRRVAGGGPPRRAALHLL